MEAIMRKRQTQIKEKNKIYQLCEKRQTQREICKQRQA